MVIATNELLSKKPKKVIKMPVYHDEKQKTWYIKFRYRDWQGKAHYTTKRGFKTKRDALKYERDFKEIAPTQMDLKLSSIAEKYLADKKMLVKISTYKKIESVLRNHILPYLGNFKISELTLMLLKDWQHKLISNEKYKYSTVKKIYSIASSLLYYAVQYYGLKENPLRKINNLINIKRKEIRRINFWTYEEFEQFISAVKNDKHKICFKILFFGGLRVGELLALNRKDFNFKENKISITKSKIQSTGEISTPKTPESEREVDMPVEIMKEVKKYIRNLKVVPVAPSPIFNTSHSALWLSLKTCAEKAGVKKIRVHDLRHSHASHLIHLGVPITTISRRLGHKSPKITLDVYSHMYAESGKQTAELLSQVINGKKK